MCCQTNGNNNELLACTHDESLSRFFDVKIIRLSVKSAANIPIIFLGST